MRVLALVKENTGVDYHRIILPLRYYPYRDGDSILMVSNKDPLDKPLITNADVVIFSRECPFDLDEILRLRQEYGFKIVVDVDDYWVLPANHVLYKNWRDNATSEAIIRAMMEADCVTTTHEFLKRRILPYNENVHILPNALPYDREQFHDRKENTKNILYSCTITHYHDIRILDRFFQLCKQDEEIQTYRLGIAGRSNKNEAMRFMWDNIEREANKYGRTIVWPYLPLDSYMNHYKYAKIAIAPLQDNEFNKCKSYLKALEAGAKYVPLLASAIHPYTEVPVIHCKTPKDWYTNLKELIRRPEIAEEKGKILGDYVRLELNLDKINEYRQHVYEQWGNNKIPSKEQQSAIQLIEDSGGSGGA